LGCGKRSKKIHHGGGETVRRKKAMERRTGEKEDGEKKINKEIVSPSHRPCGDPSLLFSLRRKRKGR
jgi:hypothetical protein